MTTSTDTRADRTPPDPGRRLHRTTHGRILAGVAVGIADWLGLDATVVRLGLVVLGLLGGLAVPLYVAAWLLIPDEGTDRSVAEEWLGTQGQP